MVSEQSHLHQLINLDVMPDSGLRTKPIPERAIASQGYAKKNILSLLVNHCFMQRFEVAFTKMESILIYEVDVMSFLIVH